MKFALTILVTISFLGVAGFGVFAMNHETSHGHTGCVAAAAQGGDCPAEESALQFLAYHFGALRGFSEAFLKDGFVLGGLLLFLAILVFAVFAHGGGGILSARFGALGVRLAFVEPDRSAGVRLRDWLALHELSPNLA